MEHVRLNKTAFYLLSFTWGLPTTLAGCLTAAVLRLTGKHPQRFGWCWYFEVGSHWGGCSMGPFFFKQKEPSRHICIHESGHAIQNCWFGFFMPFLVSIPSSIRYRVHRYKRRRHKPLPPYDAIWFEGQATRLGRMYFAPSGDDHVFYETQEQKTDTEPEETQPEER
ncbi:MAG: hypothetical protein IIZ21_03615 [Firmicutes bacterium]|nr:hypothetical protein [Bacillota bacterium]